MLFDMRRPTLNAACTVWGTITPQEEENASIHSLCFPIVDMTSCLKIQLQDFPAMTGCSPVTVEAK